MPLALRWPITLLHNWLRPGFRASPREQENIVNSFVPGRFKVNFRWVIFKLTLVVNGWGISYETAFIWVSLDHTYDKSTLVQVIAWCHQASSHYLSQCWLISLSPYGVTRPQWFKPALNRVLWAFCRKLTVSTLVALIQYKDVILPV